MQKIGRFTMTGRKLLGPGADLIELDADNGLRHTAIVFQPQYRAHRAINEALDVVRGFLEAPLVSGLVELVDHDREQGAFIYPTGQSWSVAEVIRALADMGESGGLRAGLELMYAAGQILTEASEIGGMSGVYSHGGLTPWRVLLKSDGQIMIIGEGLPQVEILTFAEDPKQIPREDAFRYCPPERIEFEPENLSSDLFGLALIAFELMTGKPVYDGLVDDIRQQAARGEGSRRLYKYRDQIPDGIRQLLTTALRPNPQDRHPSGAAFLEEVRKLLSSAESRGASLMEIMERVASQGQRIGKAMDAGKTKMISPDARAQILSELAAQDSQPPQPPRQSAPGVVMSERPQRAQPAAQPPPPAQAPPRAVPMAPEATAEAPRWGPVAGRPPRRAGFSAPEGADVEPEAASPAPSASAIRPSSIASQLLDALRADEGAEDASEGSEGGRFKPGRVRRAPRREGGEGFPALGQAADPTASAVSSRVGPPPRRGGAAELAEPGMEEPPPPPPVEAPPPPPVMVQPLLRRPAPPVEPPPPPLPVAPAQPPPPPPPLTPPAPQVAVEPVPAVVTFEPDDAPVVVTGPPPGLGPAGTPAALRPALPAAAASVPGASSFAGASLQDRAPDSLLTGRKSNSESYTFVREAGGKAVRIRLPVKSTVAEAASFLVGYVVPVRTDLSGRLTSWYRLEQDGKALAPGAALESVDASRPLVVRSIPNQIVFADIEVVGGPAPIRFVTPIGTAVPAASLVDHLAAWLALPEGRWRLVRDGRSLDGHALLADAPIQGLLRLQLRVSADEETE